MSVKDVNYLYWFFLFVIGRTTHLPELNCTIHFSSHVASLLRFSVKMLLSIERVRYAIVSSVNRLNVPRLIPVELRICMMSDISPSMTTHCVLPERKPFVHAFVFSLSPYWSSVWIKRLQVTLPRPARSPWWGSLCDVHCQCSLWCRRWTPLGALIESRMTIVF